MENKVNDRRLLDTDKSTQDNELNLRERSQVTERTFATKEPRKVDTYRVKVLSEKKKVLPETKNEARDGDKPAVQRTTVTKTKGPEINSKDTPVENKTEPQSTGQQPK